MDMDWINNRMVVKTEFAESQNTAHKIDKGHTVITIVLVLCFSVLEILEIKNGEHSPERLPPIGQSGCGHDMFGWEE